MTTTPDHNIRMLARAAFTVCRRWNLSPYGLNRACATTMRASHYLDAAFTANRPIYLEEMRRHFDIKTRQDKARRELRQIIDGMNAHD